MHRRQKSESAFNIAGIMAFRGKNAVVTGGSGGIGLETVKQLLQHEVDNLAIIDIQEMTDTWNKFRTKYPRQGLIFYKMDVANKNGLEATYSEIFKNFGSIDIVVNIAGMFNELDVMRTITVNLGGVINSTFAAMKYMGVENDGKGGIIANMSSVVGLDPSFMMPTYCATKHGIVGFTRSLSDDFFWKKTGIKFVTLCVGVTITAMLTNFPEKLLYSDMEEGSYRLLEVADKQSAADVSKCIMTILEKCENGEVYMVENKKCFPIKMASYWKLGKEDK